MQFNLPIFQVVLVILNIHKGSLATTSHSAEKEGAQKCRKFCWSSSALCFLKQDQRLLFVVMKAENDIPRSVSQRLVPVEICTLPLARLILGLGSSDWSLSLGQARVWKFWTQFSRGAHESEAIFWTEGVQVEPFKSQMSARESPPHMLTP